MWLPRRLVRMDEPRVVITAVTVELIEEEVEEDEEVW